MAQRADTALKERGLCRSRSRAAMLIAEGRVLVNGIPCAKPSQPVGDSDVLTVEDLPYAGRGGLKLAGALEVFHPQVRGLVCLDVGASTGGFTDCLLQAGAAYVYAVDVGHDQLDAALRSDPRVCSMEGTDVRSLTALPRTPALCSIDVSFISLRYVLPVVYALLADEAVCIALVKPQFEAGRSALGKHGIVRSARVHEQVLREVLGFAGEIGFAVQGICVSPVKGGSGNTEYLAYLTKGRPVGTAPDIAAVVQSAGLNG